MHRLSGQLYLITGDRDEARDCVQEAFERAWLRWDAVRAADSPGGLGPHGRPPAGGEPLAPGAQRRDGRQRHGGPADAAGHDTSSADRVALVAALQRLPEVQRTAVVLHHLCDLDVAAVAHETGASVSAVKSQLSRGRARLAELLGDGTAHQHTDGDDRTVRR